MTLELGEYAFEVALAYGAAALAVGGIIALSLIDSRRARKRLDSDEGDDGAP